MRRDQIAGQCGAGARRNLGIRTAPGRGASRGLLTFLVLSLTLAFSAASREARADCAPADPATGDTVLCSDDTPAGFQAAPGVEMLIVEVLPGATVGDAGSAAAISVNATSEVSNEGTLSVDEAGGAGILGTNDSLGDPPDTLLQNSGSGVIEVNAVGGAGIRGAERVSGDRRIVQTNGVEASIRINADSGVGMDVSNHGTARNAGEIFLGAEGAPIDDAFGMRGGVEGSELQNDGIIEGYGNSLTGLRIGDDNDGFTLNRGVIQLTGDSAVGMEAGRDNQRQSRFQNVGTVEGLPGLISILGDDGIGMRAATGTDIRNSGRIDVQGLNAIGMQTGDFSGVDVRREEVINEGEIEVSGDNARGIEVGSDFEDGNLRNLGSIVVNGGTASYGLYSGDRNSVDVAGTISVTSPGAVGVRVGDDSFIGNEAGHIEAIGSGAAGVDFGGGDDVCPGFIFCSSLFNELQDAADDGVQPVIQATGADAVAVKGGTASHLIFNEGHIIASGDNAIAIEMPNGTNEIVNDIVQHPTHGLIRGLIQVDGFAASAPGMAVVGGSGSDKLQNVGDIVGDIDLGAGDDEFQQYTLATWVGSSDDGFVDGGDGTDLLRLRGEGAAMAPIDLDAFRGFETLQVTAGSWSLSGTGALETVQVEDDASLANGGTLEVNASGGIGIQALAGGAAINQGTLQLGTDGAPLDDLVGLRGDGNGAQLQNDGLIEGFGSSLAGLRIGDDRSSLVVNRGVIRLTGDSAIAMDAGSDNQGTFQFRNDSTVSGLPGLIVIQGDDGIGMRADSGTDISNFGRISVVGRNAIGILAGDSTAVDGTFREEVLNQGEIDVVGDNARGLEVGDGYADGQFTNTGIISVNSGAAAYGIYAGDGNSLDNGGTISVLSPGAVGLRMGSDAQLHNLGSRIEVIGTDAVGVEFGAGTTSSLSNDTIVFGGTASLIQAIGSGAVAVRGGADSSPTDEISHTIINLGQIVATGDQAIGIQLPNGTNSIENRIILADVGPVRGLIQADGSNSLAVLGGTGSDTVENRSDIVGNVDLRAGDDVFQHSTFASWLGGADGFVDGGDGVDDLILIGSGPALSPLELGSFRGFEDLQVTNGGSWRLLGDGSFDNVDVMDADSTIRLDSLVSLTGDYNQGADTSLEVLLTSASSGQLDAGGVISLDPDGTLLVLTGGSDAIGDYTILSSDVSNGLAGEFGKVEFDLPGALAASFEYQADGLLVTTQRDFGANAQGSNERAVGDYLNAGYPDAEGDFLDALLAFEELSSDQASSALHQMSAEAYDAHTSTAVSWGRSATRVLEARPVRCESYAYAPQRKVESLAPCGAKGWTPWMEAIGSWGERDGETGFLSFDSSGGGLLLGVDRRFGDRWWASMDFGAGRLGMNMDDIGNGTLQTIDVGGAVGVHLARGYLRAIASYSHGWHSTRRDIEYRAVRATGEFGSDRMTAVVDGGYPLEWKRVLFEPIASLRYTSLLQDGVEESGAPGLNLRVAKRSDSLFSTSMGLRIYTALFKYRYVNPLLEWADGLWTPELAVRWRRVWYGADRHLDAVIAGAPTDVPSYRVEGFDTKSGVEFGARLGFQPLNTRITVALEYDGFFGSRNTDHHLGVGLRVPF